MSFQNHDAVAEIVQPAGIFAGDLHAGGFVARAESRAVLDHQDEISRRQRFHRAAGELKLDRP